MQTLGYGIRGDFPILERTVDGKKLIYLDNAATSQKPLQVINAVRDFYLMYNANIHRGFHTLSQMASRLYEEAHDLVAKFIGAEDAEGIIFVRSTTEAINLAAHSWGLRNLREGDEVVVTVMEHHSNLLPWFKIANITGSRVKVIDVDNSGILRYDLLEKTVTEKTKLVAVTHVSNVTGIINDIRRIVNAARGVGARVLLDGAQSVPHMPVDVRELDVDFFAFSGHKMLAPMSIGVLYVRKEVLDEMDTFLVGGGIVREVHCNSVSGELSVRLLDSPWRFEAGTPDVAGAVGLAEAIRYLDRIGRSSIHKHEVELVNYFMRRVEEEGLVDTVRYVGFAPPEMRGGILSFTLGRMDPHATAALLNEEGIAVRSGFHCAQPLLERLGFTRGCVRVSFYLYNVKEEVDRLVSVVKDIARSKEVMR
jgi:cysteine desulfurase/selenocysteine lyase